jgi:hypothetical protein
MQRSLVGSEMCIETDSGLGDRSAGSHRYGHGCHAEKRQLLGLAHPIPPFLTLRLQPIANWSTHKLVDSGCLITRFLEAPDSPIDADQRRDLGRVVVKPVPFSPADIRHVPLLQAYGLAVTEMKPGTLEDIKNLLAVRVAVQLMHLPGREV